MLVVLASFISGYQLFFVIVCCADHQPPHQDWGRAGTAGSRFARDNKELDPKLAEPTTRRAAS
jgi:hypothetical protein